MNKNTVIGLLLIFGLLMGYSIWTRPSKEELEKQKRTEDSLRLVQYNQHLADSVAQVNASLQVDSATPAPQNVQQNETNPTTSLKEQYGSFSVAATERETSPMVVENDLYRLHIQPKGGKIERVELKNVKTYDGEPVVLFNENDANNYFGFMFSTDYINVNTNNLYFLPVGNSAQDTLKVSGSDSMEIVLRLYPNLPEGAIDSSAYIQYIYTVRGDDYRTGLKISFVNTDAYLNRNQKEFELTWVAQLHQQEKSKKNEMQATNIYYSDIGDTESLSESATEGDSVSTVTRLKWVSFKQMFFSSILIADGFFDNATHVSAISQGYENELKNMKTRLRMTVNDDTKAFGMQFYFGPNKYRTLKQYEIGLENQIFLGRSIIAWINKYAIIPIFNFFEGFGWSYGLIILLLTIIIKSVLFPLTISSYKSSAKMRVVKPQIEEIGKRYPKSEDAMKKQQAVMAFYRQVGIKPMGGCLPMLLQMPILIAMFRFFPSAYELRQQAFLWADDLSTYDAVLTWDAQIPLLSTFYGNHVSLFTLLMTIATLVYTVLNNKMMSAGGNEQQMKMMKWMMYFMPIMFLGVFNNFAAGLTYYYLLVNIITFIQMGLFRLSVNEDKIRKQLELNKAKPAKKSRWQARMEAMMKAQQERAKENSNGQVPLGKQRGNTSLQGKKKR